ncbi:MAG: sodium:solute symporter family protein [Myxococcales bacterium]|nr:sodium:solute symporter family protein [Myxococcales bacterium]MCB9756754.1 sodium:solute symporter family protein [Myxococcales bacterium]
MSELVLERGIVIVYLLGCVALGVLASRRVLGSNDEYWVAGRSVGPWVNAIALMAALASGGSIIGVMGLAYSKGIPTTLAFFAGAVVGFPLASILVAPQLRRFGRFTISDFLSARFPSPVMRFGVPLLIVLSFTIYIVAQMKAAGLTAEALLGIPYDAALVISAVVFVAYVSFGGMLAVTWTDVVQGAIMLVVIVVAAALLIVTFGGAGAIFDAAMTRAPALGEAGASGLSTSLGAFVIWAAAIPVVPHVVMRVYTAKDARGAQLSLNMAMIGYVVMILLAVLVIVPVGKASFPELADADLVFHEVVKAHFPPLLRGVAVAAVIAAVMSTTDALLLACSSAVAHDLIEVAARRPLSPRALGRINVAVVWVIGAVATALAFRPPALLTELYSAAIGVLSAALFVPLIAGLWWRRANALGGALALTAGALVYLGLYFSGVVPRLSAILYALPASALAMLIGARLGAPPDRAITAEVDRLHEDAPPDSAPREIS